MIGQEVPYTPPPYREAERAPTQKELSLWKNAETSASRVNLLSYIVRTQYENIKLTHSFSKSNSFPLNEPELPDIVTKMFSVLKQVEALKNLMCRVNRLDLGVKVSDSGNDLDIVEPDEGELGWVLPAVIGAVLIAGIIARWAYLEQEVSEISNQYNGVLKRSDLALCEDPESQMCANWESAKASGGYYKRESLVDSVKSAVVSIGKTAKKGFGAGIALAIPLLLWLYAPRKKG